jgi:hypothetical protein
MTLCQIMWDHASAERAHEVENATHVTVWRMPLLSTRYLQGHQSHKVVLVFQQQQQDNMARPEGVW